MNCKRANVFTLNGVCENISLDHLLSFFFPGGIFWDSGYMQNEVEVGHGRRFTVLLRWSISCARMLEMAFSTVDCTNVIVSADGIVFWMPSSWFFEYQIDSAGSWSWSPRGGSSAKRGRPRRATVSLGIDMHFMGWDGDLMGEYTNWPPGSINFIESILHLYLN